MIGELDAGDSGQENSIADYVPAALTDRFTDATQRALSGQHAADIVESMWENDARNYQSIAGARVRR